MTITITLPDKSSKKIKKGSTPLDVALSISEGLARVTVAAKVDGVVIDAAIAGLPEGNGLALCFAVDHILLDNDILFSFIRCVITADAVIGGTVVEIISFAR